MPARNQFKNCRGDVRTIERSLESKKRRPIWFRLGYAEDYFFYRLHLPRHVVPTADRRKPPKVSKTITAVFRSRIFAVFFVRLNFNACYTLHKQESIEKIGRLPRPTSVHTRGIRIQPVKYVILRLKVQNLVAPMIYTKSYNLAGPGHDGAAMALQIARISESVSTLKVRTHIALISCTTTTRELRRMSRIIRTLPVRTGRLSTSTTILRFTVRRRSSARKMR